MTAEKALIVAIVSETWAPEINGVAMSIGRMSDGLLQRGCKLQLFRPRQGTKTRHQSVDEYLTGGLTLPFYQQVRVGLPAGKLMKKVWRNKRPDAVVVVTEGPLGFSALKAAKSLQLPVISEFHTHFEKYSKYYHAGALFRLAHRYLRRFHNSSELTLVPTKALQQKLTAQGFANVRVVARGVDSVLFNPNFRSEALRKKWGVEDGQLALIFVGRIAPEKNLPLAIKAFRAIQQKNNSARFILVGDGPLRTALQKEHKDFIFCGMQTGVDLAQHYASADLLLMPSTSETFGNILLEAMSSQLATVSYDYAAAAEHVQHDENGLKAPMDDELAFINAALALAADDKRRRRLAQAARVTAQGISWNSVTDKYLTLINELVSREVHHHDSVTAPAQPD